MRSSPGPTDEPARRRRPGDTFVDPDLQARFERDGYVVIPALSPDELQRVQDAWANTRPADSEEAGGFHSDVVGRSTEAGVLIEREVGPVLDAAIARQFVDHRRFLVSFLTKWPGHGSRLDLHQDWTYADERSDRTASFWIALDDASVALDNGPLHVLPGSHHLVDAYRGPAVADWFGELRERLEPHLVPLDVRAGQAVVLDNALLHASPDNHSGAPRRALAAAIAPRGARFLFATPGDAADDRVTLVDLDDRYLDDYDPTGPSVASRPQIGSAPRLIAVDQQGLADLVGPLPSDLADGPPARARSLASPPAKVLESLHPVVVREHRQATAGGWRPAPAQFLTGWMPPAPAGYRAAPLASGPASTALGRAAYPATLDVLLTIDRLRRAWIADVPTGGTWTCRAEPDSRLHALLLDASGPTGTAQIDRPGEHAVVEVGAVASGPELTLRNHGRCTVPVLVVETTAGRSLRSRFLARPWRRTLVAEADEATAAVSPGGTRRPSRRRAMR